MPIRNKSLSSRLPSRLVPTQDRYLIETCPTDADGFCTSQTLVSGVETELNLDGALVVNSQRNVAGVQTSDTKQGMLRFPSDLWFTTGAAINCRGKILGIDHLGRDVYYEFTKFNAVAAQTIFTMAQNAQVVSLIDGNRALGIKARGSPYCCFSYIKSIKITNDSADTTVTVGALNSGTTSNRMPRIPLPVPIRDYQDIGDKVILRSNGNATVTVPAAIPGEVAYSPTLIGRQDLLVLLIGASGGFTETVAGTDGVPYRWEVFYRGGRNAAI